MTKPYLPPLIQMLLELLTAGHVGVINDDLLFRVEHLLGRLLVGVPEPGRRNGTGHTRMVSD
jgi:hypothetical protein